MAICKILPPGHPSTYYKYITSHTYFTALSFNVHNPAISLLKEKNLALKG
jgi:hypothetical protein